MNSQSLMARFKARENPFKAERWLHLAALIMLLLWLVYMVLGYIFHAARGGPAPLEPAHDSMSLLSLSMEEVVDRQDSARLLAHPLFWQSRTPIDVTAAANKDVDERPTRPGEKLEGIELHGVFGVNDALGIIATVNGKFERFRVGDRVRGWTLKGYADGMAQFTKAGVTRTLPLDVTTPNAPPSAVPVADSPLKASTRDESVLTFGGGA